MQNLTESVERRLYIRPTREQRIRGALYSLTVFATLFVAAILFSY